MKTAQQITNEQLAAAKIREETAPFRAFLYGKNAPVGVRGMLLQTTCETIEEGIEVIRAHVAKYPKCLTSDGHAFIAAECTISVRTNKGSRPMRFASL